jgi:ferrous iron transport protein B
VSKTIAILGNPNVGKTAVFNLLTGLSQTTANYAGVTVDRKFGFVPVNGSRATLVDLPGSYSLAARSPDEMIVADVLLGQRVDEDNIDGMLIVVDASNLERNLYFVSQLLEVEKPAVLALNMTDIAKKRGIEIDTRALSRALGIPVVTLCARTGEGREELQKAFAQLASEKVHPAVPGCRFPEQQSEVVDAIAAELHEKKVALGRDLPRLEIVRLLVDEGGYAEQRVVDRLGDDFRKRLSEHRSAAFIDGKPLAAQEARTRYTWVRQVMDQSVRRPDHREKTGSERIDDILTHRLWGTLLFVGLMLVVFQAIYSWAGPIMDLVDGGVGLIAEAVSTWVPEGMLQSLLVDGVVAGVGSVFIFLPQILLLSLFIALLEDCGYMARAAFLMDKLLSWCGLSGQSFIPMLSSFACAIPGILATRTIHDRRDRFTTILVAPLMSCSARLPVYVIMIAAFVPAQTYLGGIVGLQGLTLFFMYLIGVAVAVPVAWLLKKTLFRGVKPPFILEMPTYKVPKASTVLRKVMQEGREFVMRAGTLIFAVTIVVWALAYFPRSEETLSQFEEQRVLAEANIQDEAARAEALAAIDQMAEGQLLRESYLGRAGILVEPVFLPLGWDWRIATATIASFPAREIIVATLGTLFNLGADEEAESMSLRETLRGATWPDGRPLFTLPVALSIMVFFALCCQCGATLITIKRETKQWRWPLLTFSYMTVLAYVAALIAYQGSRLILG